MLITITLLVLTTGIAIGLAIGQFSADAAPGDINACVSNYTGAVRMRPYGAITCSSGETPVSWAGTDTLGLRDPYMRGVSDSIDPGTAGLVLAQCDPGDVATGGGFAVADGSPLEIDSSSPGIPAGSWQSRATNPTGSAESLTVWAMCATP